MMKKLIFPGLFTFCFAVSQLFGQAASNVVKVDLPPAEVDRIVKKFTENESLFREALNVYAFNRYATMSTIGMGGQITGTYRRDSYLTFNQAGDRFEKILFAPISTVKEITITTEDIDNLGGITPFAIEPRVANQYAFTYLGKEKIDELNLYVFDVAPKVAPDPKHGEGKYFQGRIWVDDQDLMIVKSKGKAVPEKKQRFPVVDTIRENVDGKYWFPSWAASDDELVFSNGQAVRIKYRVRYTDYKLGRSDVKLVGEEEIVKDEPTPTPTPKKPD
ncbi:MAG: hypothetical protein IT173_14750 [Acidobacteria bacterium]|nr:hypothetical protein [Acidobacteriota bacterium]